MKKLILIIYCLGLISLGVWAQKAYKKDNKLILDCSASSGFPQRAVEKNKKQKCVLGAPSLTAFRNVSASNPYNSENDKVYIKLEVANYNLGTHGLNIGVTKMNWVDAYNGCKNLTYDGGGWRLPTQRELMMIWIFNSMFLLNSEYFWSATETGVQTQSWYVTFINGMTNWDAKTSLHYVRCVREL
ncbi:DUF1566 domain-containing protein [Bacteroides sp.]|uniref:Lcl C-terminal domain-containing protein n=1 Tax=Bacteroides sp. TaxID=29523 RepID=UPI00260688B6|nr:DUF1566 domain-containing protein [Bacteroides sp.]MDD3038672.1 DUF1566 domain-containing protein [Bacteroides sp.]